MLHCRLILNSIANDAEYHENTILSYICINVSNSNKKLTIFNVKNVKHVSWDKNVKKNIFTPMLD